MGRLRALSAQLEAYKTLLEAIGLLIAGVFAIAFVARTWVYPSAALQVSVSERNDKYLVSTTTFTVGDSTNLDVEFFEHTCDVIDGKRLCSGECFNTESFLVQGIEPAPDSKGIIPTGDSLTWSCLYKIPKNTCVEITHIVKGKAVLPSWGTSKWWATTISCVKPK